jgi:hypothetical protein
MGGSSAGPVDKGQHEVEDWERLADAINGALEKGVLTSDEIDERAAQIQRRWNEP